MQYTRSVRNGSCSTHDQCAMIQRNGSSNGHDLCAMVHAVHTICAQWFMQCRRSVGNGSCSVDDLWAMVHAVLQVLHELITLIN